MFNQNFKDNQKYKSSKFILISGLISPEIPLFKGDPMVLRT